MNTSKRHARVLAVASPILGSCLKLGTSGSQAADLARQAAEIIVDCARHERHDMAIAYAIAAMMPIDEAEMRMQIKRAAAAVSLMDTDIRILSV